jgi:L,D-transpeptidase YcbB
MTGPRVALLRARLQASSDPEEARLAATTSGATEFYDDELNAAVLRFQDRHGLAQDGKVGAKTRAALNVPIGARIQQMVLNLERRRWMPDDRGARYVFVNLADFELKVVHEPRTVFDTRVVVGAPYHRTPVFSAEMTYLEINPYWNVPRSIARNELLPKIREDPGYLAANDFELLSDWSESAAAIDPRSVDWSRITPETFAYRLRQRPGDGNALGPIKFMFLNRFNVYLHDTPARHLSRRPSAASAMAASGSNSRKASARSCSLETAGRSSGSTPRSPAASAPSSASRSPCRCTSPT